MNTYYYSIKKRIGLCCAAAIMTVIASCSGSKSTVTTSTVKRYERPPIKETTDEILKTEAMMIEAKMLEEVDKREEAATMYHTILTRDASQCAAHYELSRLMAIERMGDSAIYHAQAAVKCDNNNVWYKLHLATLYRISNQKKQYINTWEQIVNENPEVLDYYYELSNAYLMDNDFKGAIGTLNRIEKRVGITETASTQKAKLWSHLGREDKALEEMEALANAMPGDSRYNGILAESYMAAKQYDKAKKFYDRVLETDPDDEYIHISLAEYYKATGKPRRAYEELKKGFELNKLSTTNKIQILTNFYSSEEFYGIYAEQAYDLLETIMQNSDDSTSYAAFYGDVLMRQKRFDEASHQFTLALKADSSKYEIWEALLVSEMQGGTESAVLEKHAVRASKLFPLHPLPYYMQSVAAYDAGRYEEAASKAKHCEDLGFDKGYLEAETYNLLAACYSRLGDRRSIDYYAKYLKLHPDDVNAMNSYAYQMALAGEQLDLAERLSKATLKAEPNNPYYLDTYAWILHLTGRDNEAKPYIEKAMLKLTTEEEDIKEHYKIIMNDR